jgi:hypothetical protein
VLEQEYSIYNSILKPFIGEDLIVGKKYSSPLPNRRDSSPSFSVKEIKGTYRWRDFGNSSVSGDKPINLIMELQGISYHEALDVLERSDFPPIPIKSKKESEYKIKHAPLNFTELLFWEQYHVQPSTLRKYQVRGLRYMWKDTKVTYNHERDPIAFVYLGETENQYQIYSPKTRRPRKWMQFNESFILGLAQTPLTGNTLIIASGLKDGAVLYEATGIPFISGCGEGDTQNIVKILPELRLRFRSILTLLDPDQAGRRATEKFKEIGIPPHPFNYPNSSDDLADLGKKRGLQYLKQNIKLHGN